MLSFYPSHPHFSNHRELVNNVTDLGAEEVLELARRPSDAVIEGSTGRLDQQGVQLTHRFIQQVGIRDGVEVVGIVTVGAQGLHGLGEEPFEEITRPLDGVLDLVRIVLQRADRNALFYALYVALSHTLGVVRRSVTLRQERHHNLRIPAGTQSAAFKQGLAELHTARVHVPTRLHVVQRVAHGRERLHEGI